MRIASARSGWGWRAYSPITNQGDFRHTGHVHVSYPTGGIINLRQFDTGGRLRPGWTLAYNGTNKDETVRTHAQEQQLRAGGGGSLVVALP